MDPNPNSPLAFLGLIATILSALAAIGSAVAAYFAVKVAKRQWEEARAMRRAQTEPSVFVAVQPREEWISNLDMIIQNRGNGFAYDLRFDSSPDFEHYEGEFLSSIGPFKYGLSTLSPQQTIRFFFTSLVAPPVGKLDKKFEILVRYRDGDGKTYRHVYLIDLRELSGLMQLDAPPLHSMARSLEHIKEDVRKIANGFSRIQVQIHFRRKFAKPLVRSVITFLTTLPFTILRLLKGSPKTLPNRQGAQVRKRMWKLLVLVGVSSCQYILGIIFASHLDR